MAQGREKAMYEERTYRRISRPQDLTCYEVRYKETDLFCCTTNDLSRIIEERVFYYRNQLEGYIRQRPEFLHSLVPVSLDRVAPKIAREMMEAAAVLGVGPMACVAGAVAEFIGRDIDALSDDYIIENGGDIYLRTRQERRAVIYAKDSPYSGKIAIRLKPSDASYGMCTSSASVGHSLSMGKTDAVCVMGKSALFTDGLATLLGNLVKAEDDIAEGLETGQAFPGVTGILIILGEKLGAWGDLELTKV
jgi:hypothetical protein